MRPEWLWDKDISVEEIQAVLKDPNNERFVRIAALLLSRNNEPKEIFDRYLDKLIFVRNWTHIKRQMRKDAWNDPRIIFWQAVYEKLVIEFKEMEIEIFERKQAKVATNLSWRIGRLVKAFRDEEHLTQREFAKKLDISQQLVSRLENGQENLSLATIEKISQALGQKIQLQVHFMQGSPQVLFTKLPEQRLNYQAPTVSFSTNGTYPNISILNSEDTGLEK